MKNFSLQGLEDAAAKSGEVAAMLQAQADNLSEGKRQLSKSKNELNSKIKSLEDSLMQACSLYDIMIANAHKV